MPACVLAHKHTKPLCDIKIGFNTTPHPYSAQAHVQLKLLKFSTKEETEAVLNLSLFPYHLCHNY